MRPERIDKECNGGAFGIDGPPIAPMCVEALTCIDFAVPRIRLSLSEAMRSSDLHFYHPIGKGPAIAPPKSHPYYRPRAEGIWGAWGHAAIAILHRLLINARYCCDSGGAGKTVNGTDQHVTRTLHNSCSPRAPEGKPHDLGQLRSCPEVAEQMPTRCSNVAAKAQSRLNCGQLVAHCRPTSAKLDPSMAQLGPPLGQDR